MLEDQSQQTSSSGSSARIFIAIFLLALAIPLGIWVLTIVSATIKDTERPAILQKIFPEEDKPVTINTPNGKIELPAQVFRGFSYTILFMFLLIPTSIAMALLKGGITLLKPDLTMKMMRGLVESLVKIQAPKE
ncbi:MAG: hypothetical protein ABII09_08995 [Planctomycetota bacterium]